MPTYDYYCKDCGSFEAIRSMARRDDPAHCPHCGLAASRTFLASPQLALMPQDRRIAMSINEKAQHEPKLSSQYRHRAGCGCCKPSGKIFQDIGQPKAPKSFVNKRPWMISH